VDGWPLAVPAAGFLDRSPFFRAASLADALAGCLLFYGLVSILPAPYITGTYLIAILMPLTTSLYFNDFRIKEWRILSILVVCLGAFSH
jgi:hypothetical protein